MNGRTLVIGDIHGARRALDELLQRCELSANDTLIFLGDLVDGWSEAAETVERLIELQKTYTCIFIRGNHDAWTTEWLRTGTADPVWLKHGGASTLASYEKLTAEDRRSHLQFFERMQDYHIDTQNRLFIHAGFSSMHGPSHERYDSNFRWDRTLWEMALCMDNRIATTAAVYPKRLLLFSEIYIGHTPTLTYGSTLPMQGCNVWNVDTGAAFYGPLTAVDIYTKKYWQSTDPAELYPHEKGRNP